MISMAPGTNALEGTYSLAFQSAVEPPAIAFHYRPLQKDLRAQPAHYKHNHAADTACHKHTTTLLKSKSD